MISAENYDDLSIISLLNRANAGDLDAQEVVNRRLGLVEKLLKYSEDQPRDERGRFGSTAGESVSGLFERKGLAQAVNNTVKSYLEDNYDRLVERGLIDPSQDQFKQLDSAAKAMVMEDIANRMSGVRIENVASAVADFSRVEGVASDSRNGRGVLTSEQLLATIEDDNAIMMFDGKEMYVYDANNPPQLSDGILFSTPEEKETALREMLSSSLIQNWAQTSNDANVKSLAIQDVAETKFGVENATPWPNGYQNQMDEVVEKHGATLEAFLGAQYSATQAFLEKNEVTEVTLFRGMNVGAVSPTDSTPRIPIGDNVEVAMRPLSSWTTREDTANGFGTHIFTSTLPAERIFSLPTTGFGCRLEDEVVVLGGVTNASVAEIDHFTNALMVD